MYVFMYVCYISVLMLFYDCQYVGKKKTGLNLIIMSIKLKVLRTISPRVHKVKFL
jgi:hypothetical protein